MTTRQDDHAALITEAERHPGVKEAAEAFRRVAPVMSIDFTVANVTIPASGTNAG